MTSGLSTIVVVVHDVWQRSAGVLGRERRGMTTTPVRTPSIVVPFLLFAFVPLMLLPDGLTAASTRLLHDVLSRIPAVEHGAAAGAALLVAVAGWVAWRRRRDPAGLAALIVAGSGAAAAYLVSELVKVVIAEPRPCAALLEVAVCPPAGDWSFPSNHATAAVALATAIALSSRRARRWVLWVALAVCLSRVGEGVHTTADVVTGAALGAGLVLLLTRVLAGRALMEVAGVVGRVLPSDTPRPTRQER